MCFILVEIDFLPIQTVYAMEPDSSAYDAFTSKFNSVQRNAEWWRNQAHEAAQDFKTVLNYLGTLGPNDTELRGLLNTKLEVVRESIKDSQTNLSSEERMLKILQARKDAGNYTLPSSSSTVTKRSLDS